MNDRNELTLLLEAWERPEPPSPAAHQRARTALLAHTRRAPARRRHRLAVAGALAAAVAVAITVVDVANRGGDGSGPTASTSPRTAIAVTDAKTVLEHAALVAGRRRISEPRDDQWIYTKDSLTSTEQPDPQVQERWQRVDGRAVAFFQDGNLNKWEEQPPPHPRKPIPGVLAEDYGELAKLPRDPARLVSLTYRQLDEGQVTGCGSRDTCAYGILTHILGEGVLPPGLEAAIFRALRQIPGVTAGEETLDGHQAVVLSKTDEWLRQDLFVDKDTYAYLGQRGVVTKDAVISPEKAGNATGEIKAGHVAQSIRLAAGVVDEAGQRG